MHVDDDYRRRRTLIDVYIHTYIFNQSIVLKYFYTFIMSQNQSEDNNNIERPRRALSTLSIPLYQSNSFLQEREVTELSEPGSEAFVCSVDLAIFKKTAAGKRASKAWCWTINNPTDLCRTQLELNASEPLMDISFACWSREEGEETHTPHIQGYVRFPRRHRCYVVVNDFLRYWSHGCWANIDVARGTDVQNRAYIQKHPLPWNENDALPYVRMIGTCQEIDLHISQGKRTDIVKFMDYCSNNFDESELDLARRFPKMFANRNRAFERFRELSRREHMGSNYDQFERSNGVRCIVFWGVSNAGKSYSVMKDIRDRYGVDPYGTDVFWKSQPKWNNGYEDQKIIVLDDFRGSWMPMWALLKLLDPSPYSWEVKGSMVPVLAHTIYITSPFPPERWYKTDDSYEQIVNRVLHRPPVGEIRHFPTARENSFVPHAQAANFNLPPEDFSRQVALNARTITRRRVVRPRGRAQPCQCNNLVCNCNTSV